MATYPSGILSFLYNVMNDSEINDKFRNPKDRNEVMEFFMLNDELRKIFRDASQRFYEQRKVLAQERLGSAYTEAALGTYEISYEDAEKIAEKEFSEYEDTDVKVLLKAVMDELKECYGRFW